MRRGDGMRGEEEESKLNRFLNFSKILFQGYGTNRPYASVLISIVFLPANSIVGIDSRVSRLRPHTTQW